MFARRIAKRLPIVSFYDNVTNHSNKPDHQPKKLEIVRNAESQTIKQQHRGPPEPAGDERGAIPVSNPSKRKDQLEQN